MSDAKRFFYLNEDDDNVNYIVVARDMEHAEQILRDSGIEFGDPSYPYDRAKDLGILVWNEMTQDEVSRCSRCGTDDGRGVIALSDAVVGDWFCSEW